MEVVVGFPEGGARSERVRVEDGVGLDCLFLGGEGGGWRTGREGRGGRGAAEVEEEVG